MTAIHKPTPPLIVCFVCACARCVAGAGRRRRHSDSACQSQAGCRFCLMKANSVLLCSSLLFITSVSSSVQRCVCVCVNEWGRSVLVSLHLFLSVPVSSLCPSFASYRLILVEDGMEAEPTLSPQGVHVLGRRG